MSERSPTLEAPPLPGFVDDASVDDAARIPGPLRGTVTLVLQTAFAQRLVTGRLGSPEAYGTLGLFGFAQLLRPIWRAAEASDPYADWWLLKVERALGQAESELQDLNTRLLASLSGSEALQIAPAKSVRPVRTTLSFSAAQAFRGAQLVARADDLARGVLTARHVGCLTAQVAANALWKTGHAVRGAFGRARGFVPTGITRAELINATPRAAHVVQRMGILPQVVLEETVRPAHLPRRQSPARVIEIVATPVESLDDTRDAWPADLMPDEGNAIAFEDDLSDLFSSP